MVSISEHSKILGIFLQDRKDVEDKILEKARQRIDAQNKIVQARQVLDQVTDELSHLISVRDNLEKTQNDLCSKLYCHNGGTQPLPN